MLRAVILVIMGMHVNVMVVAHYSNHAKIMVSTSTLHFSCKGLIYIIRNIQHNFNCLNSKASLRY
jgi:hypothetical protein